MHPLADPKAESLRLDQEAKSRAAQDAWREFAARRDALQKAGRDLVEDKAAFAELRDLHNAYEEKAKEAQEAKGIYISALEGRNGNDGLTGRMPDNVSKSLIAAMGEKAFDVTSGGTATSAFYDPLIRTLPQRRLFVRSVVPTTAIDTDKFDFLRATVATHNAAETAMGGLKPTSVYSFERVSDRVRTVAHLSEPVDRVLLLDLDNMQTFVDGQLRLGLLLREDAQIIAGNGTGENLRGILNTAGILTTARGGAEAHVDAIFRAITALRSQANPYEPTAIVLNPADWQDTLLTRDANGNYQASESGAVQSGDIGANGDRLWGKEVITSPVMPAGTGLVGDFNQCRIYDREQARVDWADSGALGAGAVEIFSRNQLVARAEERIGFAVERPTAFHTVTNL